MPNANLTIWEATYIQDRIEEGYDMKETLRGDFRLSPNKVIGWLKGANENSEIQAEILKNK